MRGNLWPIFPDDVKYFNIPLARAANGDNIPHVKSIHINRNREIPMTTTDIYPPSSEHPRDGRSFGGRMHDGRPNWFTRSEGWLDDRGKGAWIAAMVLGFVFFWPIGLALLAYMIWSKRMFGKSCNHEGHHGRHMNRHHYRAAMRTSGNTAFDAYKSETLRRLEEEQSNFEAFLARLREAKDKAEFDNFMDDRARKAANGDNNGDQGQSAA
jgi:hypothetical protein